MVVVFGDAVAILANGIRAALADTTLPYAVGAQVGTRTPSEREPHAGPAPLVVVTQDGPGLIQQRANNRVPIRLAVWATTDDAAFDLTMLVHGIATEMSGPSVRAVLPGVSPTRDADPDTGEPMGWCSVTALVKPRNL